MLILHKIMIRARAMQAEYRVLIYPLQNMQKYPGKEIECQGMVGVLIFTVNYFQQNNCFA